MASLGGSPIKQSCVSKPQQGCVPTSTRSERPSFWCAQNRSFDGFTVFQLLSKNACRLVPSGNRLPKMTQDLGANSHHFGWLWTDCRSVIRRGWAANILFSGPRMGGFAHSGGLGDQFTPQQQHLFTRESLQRVATGRTCLSVPFQGILIVDDMGDVFLLFPKHLKAIKAKGAPILFITAQEQSSFRITEFTRRACSSACRTTVVAPTSFLRILKWHCNVSCPES